MIDFLPRPVAGKPLVVLCLGAHPDDIEIGCGGTLLRFAREWPTAQFHWRILSSNPVRKAETLACAEQLMLEAKGRCDVQVLEFRDGFLPYEGYQVKEAFEKLKQEIQPDLILTHFRHDLHQDHRLICELTWNTFRNHTILEYEIPKYDGDIGKPNLFVALSLEEVEKKVAALLACHVSQRSRDWFSADLFKSLMRLRGMECNAPSGYAEAYHARKIKL
jgi:LmbE family N-acetylglucosaminyl deacetylase